MLTNLKHSSADVCIEELPNNRRLISIHPTKNNLDVSQKSCETSYPLELIELILNIQGPRNLCDEISRDEDPDYVQACLEKDIFGYLPKDCFFDKNLLDFGCGTGASTVIMARMLSKTQITGIDLSEKLLKIAQARSSHYGYSNINFYCSPAGDKLPDNIGKFDFIVLSAVFEHLLPPERKNLLPMIWDLLKPNGVLFIDQTPYRYSPFEGHTTRLPFINYLPDRLAHSFARKFSSRVKPDESWSGLLRRGIRGGSLREITNILRESPDRPTILQPNQLGLYDRIDLWYAGYAVSIANKYPGVKRLQQLLKIVFKFIKYTTGLTILPSLSLAIRKTSYSKSTQQTQKPLTDSAPAPPKQINPS